MEIRISRVTLFLLIKILYYILKSMKYFHIKFNKNIITTMNCFLITFFVRKG